MYLSDSQVWFVRFLIGRRISRHKMYFHIPHKFFVRNLHKQNVIKSTEMYIKEKEIAPGLGTVVSVAPFFNQSDSS